MQKIYNLQTELWYPYILNDVSSLLDTCPKPSYLGKALNLINSYNFSIDYTFNTAIIGGSTPIRDYIKDLTIMNDLKSLRKKNIIYMDQLVSPDGHYLLTWADVKRNNNNSYAGSKPKWFTRLEENYILSHHRRLVNSLKEVTSVINRTYKSPTINNSITYPKFEWTFHWHNQSRSVTFGKTLSQETDSHSSVTYLEHYVSNQEIENRELTPRRQHLYLSACQGCSQNSYYPMDARLKCVISTRTQRLILFKVHNKSAPELSTVPRHLQKKILFPRNRYIPYDILLMIIFLGLIIFLLFHPDLLTFLLHRL